MDNLGTRRPVIPQLVQDVNGDSLNEINETIGKTTDTSGESTVIGLLKKTESNTESAATEATTQELKTLVGTADDAVGTNTVIGLLKGIAAKF